MSNLRCFGHAVLLLGVLLTLAGCTDFGQGGTGELVVPRQALRDIESTEFQPLPATGPATQIATTRPSTQPAEQRALTIEEVRQMALANNIEIQVELLSPTIARQDVSAEAAQFEAVFTTNANYANLDQPTSTELVGSQVRDFSITPGLQIPLITGGTINVNVPMDRLETNNQFSTLNPAYSSDVAASISVPLLQGAGIDANVRGIRVAFYEYQASEARTKLAVIRVLATADRAYWRVYAARKALEVAQKNYELAVTQLERARRQVRAGIAAETEIIRAESGVADQVEAVINADNALRDRQRELKRILNEPGMELDTPVYVVPTTPPSAVPYAVNPQQLLAVALDKRMELLELELRIAAESANIAFAKNGLLPLVTLSYDYAINGLGESFGDSFDMVADTNFQDNVVGLQVQIPIGNEAARSRLRRSIASRQQQLATRDQRILQIKQEVLNAVDQLEANWQRILAGRQRTILAARVLEVEIRQFDLGIRTSTDVLDAQIRLAQAQLDEISAVADYQISQIDIAFATGMVLGRSNVSWEPTKAPEVGRYWP